MERQARTPQSGLPAALVCSSWTSQARRDTPPDRRARRQRKRRVRRHQRCLELAIEPGQLGLLQHVHRAGRVPDVDPEHVFVDRMPRTSRPALVTALTTR